MSVKLTITRLPETGYLRLAQIIGHPGHPGDPTAKPPKPPKPPIPAMIPISRSWWWEGVRTGKYPKPEKLGPNTTVWRVEDILALIEKPEDIP